MKLPVILFLVNFIFVNDASGQKIEKIQQEQFGNDIRISFDLNGTLPSQMYFVKVECLNDGRSISLINASGNGFGKIRGGANRQVFWEVLKDTPTLVGNNIVFKITADLLLVDESSAITEPRSRGMSLQDQKATLIGDFSTSVDNYLEQAYNLVTTFQAFGKTAFESRGDYSRLQQQLQKTNDAYEKLQPLKESYKQTIRSFWGSEAINCQAEGFIDRIVDKMHRSYLLPLNKTLLGINEIASDGKMKSSEKNQKTEKIKIEIDIRCSQLIEEVNAAKGDAKAIYELLKQ